MWLTVVPTLIDAFRTVPKSLERVGLKDLEIRGPVETFQTTALYRPEY